MQFYICFFCKINMAITCKKHIFFHFFIMESEKKMFTFEKYMEMEIHIYVFSIIINNNKDILFQDILFCSSKSNPIIFPKFKPTITVK